MGRALLWAILMAVAAVSFASPAAARPAIAIVTNNTSLDPGTQTFARLAAGLEALGRDPDTIEWTRRSANRDHDLLDRYAAEVIAMKPDLIIAGDTTATRAVYAAQQARGTHIPVVFWSLDPIGAGVIADYDKPGTDFTGAADAPDTQRRQLELLGALVPGIRRVGMLYNPTYAPAPGALREFREAGAALGIEVRPYETLSTEAFATSIAAMARDGMQAMVVGPHSLFSVNGRAIGELAQAHRLPAVSLVGSVLAGGGVAAFGPDFQRIWFEQAAQVDAILRGQAPATLAVRRPPAAISLNLAAAQALGLTVPEHVRSAARSIGE